MQAPAGPPFFFDPFDEAPRRDPYALFARARREHPAWRHEGLPVVSVFRHADCQTILRDPQVWSSAFPTPPGFAPEDVPRSMLVTNPPEHTRLRALVSLAFTPRRVRQLAPRIETIAHELLDGALARRGVDLVETLAYPLPVVVIAELIGVPAEDRAQFKAWSNALVAPLGTAFFEVAPPERVATLRQVRGELEAYFVRLVEARRREPRDDLLSALVAAELEGSRLSFEELLAMLILLLVAGNETTTHLIGNAVLALLAHPEALAALRAAQSRVPAAVEEVLRFSSPVQTDPRLATEVRHDHVADLGRLPHHGASRHVPEVHRSGAARPGAAPRPRRRGRRDVRDPRSDAGRAPHGPHRGRRQAPGGHPAHGTLRGVAP